MANQSEKMNLNTNIEFDLILGTLLDHFWTQNRYKIDPKTVLEGPWMRISFRSSKKTRRGSSGQLRLPSKLGVLEPLGEGNREGANGFTRLTSLGQAKGSADLLHTIMHRRMWCCEADVRDPKHMRCP